MMSPDSQARSLSAIPVTALFWGIFSGWFGLFRVFFLRKKECLIKLILWLTPFGA